MRCATLPPLSPTAADLTSRRSGKGLQGSLAEQQRHRAGPIRGSTEGSQTGAAFSSHQDCRPARKTQCTTSPIDPEPPQAAASLRGSLPIPPDYALGAAVLLHIVAAGPMYRAEQSTRHSS